MRVTSIRTATKPLLSVVILVWGVASLRVYDLNNRLLAQGKPAKVSMKPTDRAFPTWEVPLAGLLRGTYRVDVLLGPDPAWRAFFRVVE